MRYLRLALLPLVLVACADREPLAPDIDVTPSLAVAGNSGCATPHFAVTLTPTGGFNWEGTVTGDFVGTTEWVYAGSPTFAGVTWKTGGVASWDITGGVLGALTFDTEFDQLNLLPPPPGSPVLLINAKGKHRAVGGVEKANLQYKGSILAATLMWELDFQGVVCP